jgi:hypothetical protein
MRKRKRWNFGRLDGVRIARFAWIASPNGIKQQKVSQARIERPNDIRTADLLEKDAKQDEFPYDNDCVQTVLRLSGLWVGAKWEGNSQIKKATELIQETMLIRSWRPPYKRELWNDVQTKWTLKTKRMGTNGKKVSSSTLKDSFCVGRNADHMSECSALCNQKFDLA